MFSVRRSADEVRQLLESLLVRQLNDGDWDNFISTKIEDKFLESIRGEMESIWQAGSPYLEPDAIDPNRLSEKGRAKLRELIVRCENYDKHRDP